MQLFSIFISDEVFDTNILHCTLKVVESLLKKLILHVAKLHLLRVVGRSIIGNRKQCLWYVIVDFYS